jgi:hypothetical protein
MFSLCNDLLSLVTLDGDILAMFVHLSEDWVCTCDGWEALRSVHGWEGVGESYTPVTLRLHLRMTDSGYGTFTSSQMHETDC